jgi:hypothetical protein
METIFTLGDLPEGASRVNLDDLYERTKEVNLNTLATFNSVLNRIHLKIKLMSRSQRTEQFCWYVIPEMIIGVPNYNHTMCTAYIIDQLNENGFIVKYTSPNLLFVSWKHWIPSYVRHEIKKKTGIVVDGYGNKLVDGKIVTSVDVGLNNNNNNNTNNSNSNSNNNNKGVSSNNNGYTESKRVYKPIDTYKPSGNLYNHDILKAIQDKTLR